MDTYFYSIPIQTPFILNTPFGQALTHCPLLRYPLAHSVQVLALKHAKQFCEQAKHNARGRSPLKKKDNNCKQHFIASKLYDT